MIEEEWRYFAPGGSVIGSRGPSTWNIVDWDQRRTIAVTMDEKQESADCATEHLKKYVNTIGTDVYSIHLSLDGELISTSTNPEDDEATCVYYPPLQTLQLEGVKTVLRSDLVELDRLTPNVDLVCDIPCVCETDWAVTTQTRKLVFKYYFLVQFQLKVWHEMNLWMRLPPHPNIVPFDRVVLDEIRGDIVGFTSIYIPGGTLSQNKSRPFKIEWLRQLTLVIDDLNLKYGIVHQDVAPRNLLINPETDDIMLFDFNYSSRIGDVAHSEGRDDIKGVIFTLYEIITRDMHFREISFHHQDTAEVENMKDWVQRPEVKLDSPVSEYRSVLDELVKRRREGKKVAVYTEAPEYIDWPSFPRPPPKDVVFGAGEQTTVMSLVSMYDLRRAERERGTAIVNWERPLQTVIDGGKRVLANGELCN